MPSTWPHPQFQLRTELLLWTSSKNKYFAFISPAQWKHFSKLLPRWYLVLLWVSSPCSWLSNGQTCLIVILKEKKKPTKKQTSCIFKELYCFPLAQAGSDTIKCESWEKESKQEQALFGTSPLILLTSPVYFIQSEEGIGECYEEVRKEYDCFMQKMSFWYQPAFYVL